MLFPFAQGVIFIAGLGWASFRIFRPLGYDALPSDRDVRVKERVLFALGLVLLLGGFPTGIYLGNLLSDLGMDFWLRFTLEMIPSLIGCGLIGWALFLNFREYGSSYR